MQLIVILLTTVAVLTFLSGVIVFFGSSKSNRVRSAWFLFAAIFATIWMASISSFLIADPSWSGSIDWHVKWTFISAILIDVSFLGYVAWQEKHGPIVTLSFLTFGLIISALIFLEPGLLYNSVNLSRMGNSVDMNIGPLYFAYVAFFGAIVPAIIIALLKQSLHTKSTSKRGGDLIIMVSFGLSSTLILIANLILPLFNNWSIVWLGPLALSTTIIVFYYTILRYHALNLSSIWLRVFSYIVIIASLAIVYMIIFSVVFAALFRGSTPSTEVIVLNFIMILIFLLLMPALNQVSNFVRSLITNHDNRHKNEKKGHGKEVS